MNHLVHDWSVHLFPAVFLITDLTIRIGLSVRVIMRKKSYGVSLAWLVIILLVPFVGGFFYLLFGENRISEERSARIQLSFSHYQHWLKTLQNRTPVVWEKLNPECLPLQHLAKSLTGLPAMGGNDLKILNSPEEVFNTIIRDINQAKSTCHLQFYIWEEGGQVDAVIDALLRAALRGVTCRLLLDAIGCRNFLSSPLAGIMKESGIRIQESLPAGLIKALFARVDIRNHRKIIIIDGRIAYTGSQNMVDPYVYRQEAKVGNWIDIMVRIQGPVVECLAGTFISDWFLESDTAELKLLSLLENPNTFKNNADVIRQEPVGNIAMQMVPSGPGFNANAIHSLLLTTIYAARKELILTTPYFIPDEALLAALKSASLRGVQVTIIIPAKNESRLAQYATRARFEELHQTGVQFKLFTGGFLHSKTITIDEDFALFGSVNLDMRSFWLNFEATLLIYDQDICAKLRTLQIEYMASADDLDMARLSNRSIFERLKENAVLLIGPLL
jgi:cardiolipin synthase